MTDVNHHKSHYILGTKNFVYDPKNIESCSLEELLKPMTDLLELELETTKHMLDNCGAKTETTEELSKLIHYVQLLKDHFDFTLAVLGSQSKEEVQKLKEKFSSIRKYYEELNDKDQFTPIPARYVVVLFHDKMIVALPRLLKKCFATKKDKKITLVMSDDNRAKLKILAYRFELAEEHYSRIIMFNQNDIFNLPKNSSVWKELYKHVTFKEILTEQEAIASFKRFELTNNIGHVIVKNQIENDGILHFKGATRILKDLIYYFTAPRKAETFTLLRLVHPKAEDAFRVWNLPEEPFVSFTLSINYPIIAYDERIYLPRLFPKITRDLIMREYETDTFNKLCPMENFEIKPPNLADKKEELLEELFVESEDKITVRILANDHLNLKESTGNMLKGLLLKATRVITGPEKLQPQPPESDSDGAILIHIHGGGFVSMSSGTHRIYLNRWVKNLKMVCFSIDYRLAPKNIYPDALDDVWQAYLWIVNYAETILGIKTKRIILFGDSAGGTLALGLMFRLLRANLPLPSGCLLIYPAMVVDENSCSPSAFASLDDPVLPTAILKHCARAYLGQEEFKSLDDPCISPLSACDDLLSRLPPIRMVVGSKDPLHDDSWRFLSKMTKLNKDIKLIVHENIRHAYLCHQDLKKYHVFMEEACDLIRELLCAEKRIKEEVKD